MKRNKVNALNGTLILRLQQETLALIEEWAENKGVSKSFIARYLIGLGIDHYKGKLIR